MFRSLAIILTAAVVLSACSLPLISKKQAALQITSSQTAAVYLNTSHVGNTPFFDDNLKPDTYTIRLSPESGGSDWETKVTLTPKLLTVINRIFAPTPEESSYYIMQLEPLSNQAATELSVVASPDTAIVKVDGQPKGFAPLNITSLTPGDHTINLVAPGHQDIEINAKAQAGHKLTISAQLARQPVATPVEPEPEATPSGKVSGQTDASPSPSPKTSSATSSATSNQIISGATSPAKLDKPYVKILDTGTGWLRVHSDTTPGDTNEVAKIKVGTYFAVTSSKSGWYEIEYQSGKTGWITSRYAELID